jgi:hypothetical protein
MQKILHLGDVRIDVITGGFVPSFIESGGIAPTENSICPNFGIRLGTPVNVFAGALNFLLKEKRYETDSMAGGSGGADAGAGERDVERRSFADGLPPEAAGEQSLTAVRLRDGQTGRALCGYVLARDSSVRLPESGGAILRTFCSAAHGRPNSRMHATADTNLDMFRQRYGAASDTDGRQSSRSRSVRVL